LVSYPKIFLNIGYAKKLPTGTILMKTRFKKGGKVSKAKVKGFFFPPISLTL
jgi:hypothetical protein